MSRINWLAGFICKKNNTSPISSTIIEDPSRPEVKSHHAPAKEHPLGMFFSRLHDTWQQVWTKLPRLQGSLENDTVTKLGNGP